MFQGNLMMVGVVNGPVKRERFELLWVIERATPCKGSESATFRIVAPDEINFSEISDPPFLIIALLHPPSSFTPSLLLRSYCTPLPLLLCSYCTPLPLLLRSSSEPLTLLLRSFFTPTFLLTSPSFLLRPFLIRVRFSAPIESFNSVCCLYTFLQLNLSRNSTLSAAALKSPALKVSKDMSLSHSPITSCRLCLRMKGVVSKLPSCDKFAVICQGSVASERGACRQQQVHLI